MITASTRTELEESIQACCRSLFLTSAIPDLVKKDGTPSKTLVSFDFSVYDNCKIIGHAELEDLR